MWTTQQPQGVTGTAGLPAQQQCPLPCSASLTRYQLFSTLAVQPYLCVVPELVPPSQRGTASGWQGMMQALGTLAGAAGGIVAGDGVSGERPTVTYAALMALNVGGMAVTASVLDRPSSAADRRCSGAKAAGGAGRRHCSGTAGGARAMGEREVGGERGGSGPNSGGGGTGAGRRRAEGERRSAANGERSAFFGAFTKSPSFCWLFLSSSLSASSAANATFFLQASVWCMRTPPLLRRPAQPTLA